MYVPRFPSFHTHTPEDPLWLVRLSLKIAELYFNKKKKLNLVNQKLTDIKWGSGKNLRIILNIKIQNKS